MPIRVLAAVTAFALLTPTTLSRPQKHIPPTDVVSADGGEQSSERGSTKDLFPPATGDLVLERATDGTPMSLFDVVQRYGRLTGQLVITSAQARDLLEDSPVPFDEPLTIPAAEVQSACEALLIASDFALVILRTEAPRMVRIEALQTVARATFRQHARTVPARDTELMRRHPALLFTTVVDLPNVDVRQLANSLRTMITDGSTMQILPAGGSDCVVLTAFGPMLADWVDYLRMIEASAAAPRAAISHELVRLRHAIAVDTANLVERALLNAREQRSGIALGGPQPVGGQAGMHAARPAPGVVADLRLNALLVTGSAEEIAEARRVIALLDVE